MENVVIVLPFHSTFQLQILTMTVGGSETVYHSLLIRLNIVLLVLVPAYYSNMLRYEM
jgi:hypothetical protein